MKTKRIALVAMFAIMAMTINAQTLNVFVDYFGRPGSLSLNDAEAVRSKVMEGINTTRRVHIIDVASHQALALEESRRNNDNITSGGDIERLKVMVSEGANFLVIGRVTNMSVKREKNDKNIESYVAQVDYTVKVVNPSNGKTITTKGYTHQAGGSFLINTGKTPEEALASACNMVADDMKEFVELAFPLKGTVLEPTKIKKKKVEELYIDLGSVNGLAEGTYFDVCIEREVAGRISNKVIGEVKVISVEGDDLSLCDVKKGKEEIKEAFDGKQTLIVKSKIHRGPLGF